MKEVHRFSSSCDCVSCVALRNASEGNGELAGMGGRFIFDVYGDSSKHPVVFLCGWGMTSEFYHEGLVGLSKNFNVYSISLPGFGDALPLSIRDSSVAGHASLISKALKGLAFGSKVTLMGHSTGAGVAVFIAESNPELVSELVLVNPVGSRDPLTSSLQRMLTKSDPRDLELVAKDKGVLKNWFYNLKLAVDAKNLNLNSNIEHLASQGVPAHILLSRSDVVAPAGSLADVKGAILYWVNGGHAYIRDNPNEFVNLCNVILSRHIVETVVKIESSFSIFIRKVKVLFSGESQS